MDDRQKARVRETLGKPVKDYTNEEGRFMTNMMRAYPVSFADILEEEVAKLRAMADRLREKSTTARRDEN